MYEELVKSLRICAVDGSCRTCPRFTICTNEEGPVLAGLMNEAADAIEELSQEYESVAKSLSESVELVHKLQSPRWIPVTEEQDGKV